MKKGKIDKNGGFINYDLVLEDHNIISDFYYGKLKRIFDKITTFFTKLIVQKTSSFQQG